jgi:hypothetical protein
VPEQVGLLGVGEPDLPPEGAARVLATIARNSVLKSMIGGMSIWFEVRVK